MATYPRRVSRGILKGKEFQSESEYRKALEKAKGKSRYQQRKERAQALGYSGYTERRKVLRKLKAEGKQEPITAGGVSGKLRDTFELMANKYKTQTREERIAILAEQAERLGIDPFAMYARFYQVIDARGLRQPSAYTR